MSSSQSDTSNERYINWINKVLFEAGKTYHVTALNDENICNGKVLYEIFEYLSKSKVVGYVNVKSKRAVLYNLQILLNRVAGLKIRMSLIQPIDIERGDIPTILRFILGLIRHYQPQFVRLKVSKTVGQLSLSQSSQSLDSTKESHRISFMKSPFKSRLQRIISTQRPNSEMSNVITSDSRNRPPSESSVFLPDTIPKDIHEIHHQLTELKKLLSRPDIVTEVIEKKDACSQTDHIDMNYEQILRQKDCFIANQQDQLNNLKINLENRTKIAESFSKELSILRTQQSRRNIDIEQKVLDQFISLLRSVRSEKKLENCDLDKFDEGINMITSLSLNKNQYDKANIAIINPCSKITHDIMKDNPSAYSDLSQHSESLNPFITESKNFVDKSETKLIFFIGKSPIPYSSVIPKQANSVTLANIKECTKSLLTKDSNLRFFFKSINRDFGSAKEEVIRDSDNVPIVDGKIIVYIQQ